jgi:hypothetical protein
MGVAIGGRLLFQHRTERDASTARVDHRGVCAAQQIRELLGVGHRLIPVAVV